MLPTKKDLLKAIRDYCKTHATDPANCEDRKCPLWAYRHQDVGLQTDVFRINDKDIFLEKVVKAAKSFSYHPFFWSELRERVGMRPLHDNWWGVSTRVLQKEGFKIIEGSRRSKFKSRCGAIDRRWKWFG